jgi:CMP-N-acetylneuraminic acid synthetase
MLDVLTACPEIEKIVIDTDSPTIKEQCARKFPQVELIDRPTHLRDGATPMNDVLLHDVQTVQSQFYLQTHSTNPLLLRDTVQRAIEAFFSHYPIYDSLFSVTRRQARYWDSLARAVNHNPNILIRTQDLPPIFEENSCLYIFERNTLIERHNRIGYRPYLFETAREEALDVDEEIDFRIAELIFKETRGVMA